MADTQKIYRFNAPLIELDKTIASHCIDFPLDVQKEFGTNSSVRMLGRINGKDIDRALIPRGDGTHYIIVSNEMRRNIGLRRGDNCVVELWLNEEPDKVTVPEELLECFEMEPEAKRAYERQTAGMQRNICYWVDSAKRPETRAKRAADMLNRLLSPEFTVGGVKNR
jgi:hypothetical protein